MNATWSVEEDASPPSLSEIIRRDRQTIIDEWMAFARGLFPRTPAVQDADMADHVPELLDAITVAMTSPPADDALDWEARAGLTSVGHKHAAHRLEAGLSLEQVVAEHRALRHRVLRRWEQAGGGRTRQVSRFDGAIDETLAASAVWYSRKIGETREQFLDILGHDLRNPLQSIMTGAGLLAKSDTRRLDDVRVARRVLASAERMQRMVNDLLDLTRTRLGGGIPVTRKPMDLAPVCREVVAELADIDPHCDLRFACEGDLRGEWDSDRITQVVSNLVANAMQYGCGHGAVSLFGGDEGDEVILRVHNEGPPIPEAMKKSVFDPMVRQPTGDADRHATGLGLGLYIARQIVAAHHGTIGFTSSEGEGVTFTVRLPRRAPRASM